MKLFGSKRGGARLAKNRPSVSYESPSYQSTGHAAVVRTAAPAVKAKNPLKVLAIILAIILVCELAYFFVIFTDNKFVSKWRNIYIETAMDTLSHKWLATAIIPSDIIAEVCDAKKNTMAAQIGNESSWGNQSDPVIDEITGEETVPEQVVVDVTVIQPEDPEEVAREAFYELFHEIDKNSMEAYLSAHPDALANGWANLYINEAGIEDAGTEIRTIYDEQVLAIDVPNKILLIRVEGKGFIGVLAKAKDPALLSVRPSSQLWTTGETAGVIAEANNGVLAMTGSGFIDPDGGGNGGLLAGYAMYNGVEDGWAHMGSGYKRLEIHEDNLFYIKDATASVGEGTTDAVEFGPALIIDGKILVDANCGYTGIHPRAAIGQSDKYEVLMLVIEGRMPTRSMGTDVIVCAEILKQHGCMQAMNLDGGTSAIMWYDGEYVTKCSNQALPEGRPLPTAFVYERAN